MSFSERLQLAEQTYHNFLQAHPNGRLNKLKALTKAISSFCNRKVMASDPTRKLQPSNAEELFFSPLRKVLTERKSSPHSTNPRLPDTSQANHVNKREEKQEAEAPLPHSHESTEKKSETQPAMTDSSETFPTLPANKLNHDHAIAKRDLARLRPKRRPSNS